MAAAGAEPRERRGPSRPRWPRRLLGVGVVLAVLGGGAAVAAPLLDDAARGLAQERVAELLADETGATGGVEVSIAGGWFLPQVVRGRYPAVRVVADGVPAGPLRLERVDAELSGVTAPLRGLLSGAPRVEVASSRAQVRLAYPVLNALLREQGRPLQVAPEPGGGGLRATTSARVLGQDVALTGLVDLRVEGGQLVAVPLGLDTGVGLLDRLSRSVLDGLDDELAFTIPVGDLPFEQQVTSAQVETSGVVATTEGAGIVVVS